MATLKSPLWLLVAAGSFFAGTALAWHHPLWPMASVAIFWLWCAGVAWRPGIWLLALPICLPFLNFSPWTGWLVFEEFDFLLLGTLAGGYGHLAGTPESGPRARTPAALLLLLVLLAVSGLLAMFRGFADAGGFDFDWFAGYGDPLNSFRIFKSLGFALLFMPLLRHEMTRSAASAIQRLGVGMVLGLTVCTLAVLWERTAFPGLIDFSTHYRAVALFWEMHVGGAAIDAYLALATPFVVWALRTARRPVAWAGAAVLALLTGYACLTTFSRGVYLAVAAPLLLLGALLWIQKHGFAGKLSIWRQWRRNLLQGWRAKAALWLFLALVLEVVAVLEGGTFMSERLASTKQDFSSRLEHWQNGLDLLDNTTEWWLGKGLGRLPENYAARVPQGEFSGDVELAEERLGDKVDNAFVRVQGPKTLWQLGGRYALTQRVDHVSPAPHRVRFDVRVESETHIELYLCERHMLYDGACQAAFLRVIPNQARGQAAWQTATVAFKGPALSPGAWYAPRMIIFSLSVIDPGGRADFDNVSMPESTGESLLANGDFSRRLAHWYPAAQSYFVPWHLDNLFLEVLVERGGLGLVLFLMLVGYALWVLVFGGARLRVLSPYLAASLSAVLLVGLVSSVMDVPRVAFLFYLLTLFAIQLTNADETQGQIVAPGMIHGDNSKNISDYRGVGL